MITHQPVVINKFNGHFDRGQDVACPPDHFLDTKNLRYTFGGLETREGCLINQTIPNVRRIQLYKRTGEATRLLILNSAGEIFDSAISLLSPILTVPGMTDFSCTVFYNRAYITPHDGTKGLAGEKVYVYEGAGTTRAAAGTAPSGAITVAESGLSGITAAGYHYFAVCYETASGFITKPGPTVYGVINASGSKKISISNIPVGPAGTTKRHILGTKSISSSLHTGNQNDYELFFIPNGTINNNVDTTITVDFYDGDLQDSADYLVDILETIPAGIATTQYAGRLVIAGENANQSTVRLSKRNDPETFDAVEGFVVADATETGAVKACVEYRNSLYIFKSLRSYVTTDNFQDEPIYWELVTVDKGAGTEVHGVSTILDAKGTSTDKFTIADRSGLLLFDGLFQKPELTWKIADIWRRITKTAFNTIEVHNDPVVQALYVLVPLDGFTSPNALLYADYSQGLDSVNIRWSVWSFPWNPVSATIDVDANSNSILRVAGYAGNVYNFGSAYTNDNGTAINCYFKTSLLPPQSTGEVFHYSALRLFATGSGSLNTILYRYADTVTKTLPSMAIAQNPAKAYLQWCNIVSEKMAVKYELQNLDEFFKVNQVVVYSKALWAARAV